MLQFQNFSKDKSTRNPLGIIALFISFIYGIAGLVIGVNFSNLQGAAERLPLIWFVIGFPILILLVFVVLVIWHNEKLYAPGDYDNQEGYFLAMGKSITPDKTAELNTPELIPVQNHQINTCMMAYCSQSNKKHYARNEINEAALKQFSVDNDLNIKTEVSISRDCRVDAIAEKEGSLYLIDVIANADSLPMNTFRKHLLDILSAAKNANLTNYKPVLLLVANKEVTSQPKINKTLQRLSQDVMLVYYSMQQIEKYIQKDKG